MISFPVASELFAKISPRQCRVPTILFSVGKRHCRVLSIIPMQPDLISFPFASELFAEIRRLHVPCPYNIIFGRETALPCPLYHSDATGFDIVSVCIGIIRRN